MPVTRPLQDGEVTTAKLAAAAVTPEKLSGAQSGNAPAIACRAFVRFTGTGTVAIDAAGNVSSITDHGTGDYSVNFTTAMPDANYSVVAMGRDTSDLAAANSPMATAGPHSGYGGVTAFSTTAVRMWTKYGSGVKDAQHVSVAIFR